MSAAHSAQLLIRLGVFMRTLAEGRPAEIAIGDAEEVANSIDRYFAQRCSLDVAMGVHLDQGEKHPGSSTATRDSHLRAAAAQLGELKRENSKKLADLFVRYEARDWQRDRGEKSCPPRLAGRIEAHFWEALKALPRVIGERQMHFIVGAQLEVKSAFDFQAVDGMSNRS